MKVLPCLRPLVPARLLRAAARVSPLLLLAGLPAALAADHGWTGGNFQPGVTAPNPVPAGDRLFLTGVGRKIIDGMDVENQGSIFWSGAGDIRLQGGSTLLNSGVLERIGTTGSASMTTSTGGGSFTNTGWVINTGAGVSLALSGGTLINQGVFDNRGGTFALPSGWTNHGTLMGGGNYSIAGAGLSNAGTLAPGSSGIGSLRLTNSNSFAQTAAGTLAIDITSASVFDFLEVAGSGFGDAALAGTLALHCLGACSMAVGEEITVLQARRSLSGRFDQVTLRGFSSGAFEVIYEVNNGTADDFVRLRVTEAVSAVSEPSAAALWLAGLAAVAGLARRRRQAR